MISVKNELLAPAGEIDSAFASIFAGADAVYLGAPMFSARAYATNLTTEEIIDVIKYAHLFNKKIYLTLNILLKNIELNDAINIVKPLYESGLDGIIVQDMGLICLLKKYFPDIEIHASTQMAVMSVGAVRLLKKWGIKRVVPARELSLEEIKNLKAENIEIECFIHGAMCYSYSGKCLFSSIAGGRSGNRGRCAGTCRKKYDTYIDGKKVNQANEDFPLSMRDMCTILDIPELLEAGIDSFKIEGRMKSPEYSAAVSDIYREVIDDYISKHKKPEKNVTKKLSQLYCRSLTSTGYIHCKNGRKMVTLLNPSYIGISDDDKKAIDDKFLNKKFKLDVSVNIVAHVDEPLVINIKYKNIIITELGDVCQLAKNKASDIDLFKKQLFKLGNTYFNISSFEADIDENVFVMVSSINSLRRKAFDKLLDTLNSDFIRSSFGINFDKELLLNKNDSAFNIETYNFKIGVKTVNQLYKLLEYSFSDNIILDWSLFVNNSWLKKIQDDIRDKNIYFRLPSVIRQFNFNKILKITNDSLKMYDKADINIKGVYVSSLDGLYIAKEIFDKNQIYAEDGLYIFNDFSSDFILQEVNSYTVSYELNQKEIKHLSGASNREMVVYGYIPLMYSAGCILKTFDRCNKFSTEEIIFLRDENNRDYRVIPNHELCFNTIYNNVPLCLYNKMNAIIKDSLALSYRIEFTIENESEVDEILNIFKGYILKNNSISNMTNNSLSYTGGHFSRGVL